MAGWKVQPTMTVNLPEDLADGLWIKTPHPKLLPHDAMKALIELAPKQDPNEAEVPNDEDKVLGFDLDKARDLATQLILEWNLPDDKGNVLPIPSVEPSVWKQIPGMPVIMCVMEVLGEGLKAAEPDPNSLGASVNI